MKKIYFGILTALIMMGTTAQAQSDLILTGVFDGPLSGGTPKALEIFVLNDIDDLSVYGLANANNGAMSSGMPGFTFEALEADSGDYIYVTANDTEFSDYFGFAADFTGVGALGVNGDDAIELYQNGVVVDVMGVVGTDGSDQPWEYLDGWMYRMDGTLTSATFNLGDWNFSGINVNDGQTSNATAVSPFPIGTYSPEGNGGGDEPVIATIPEIQETGDMSGDSPLAGVAVTTYGVVTATNGNGFWMQDGIGAWSGIYVRESAANVVLGDSVTVTATVEENFGLTRLNSVSDIIVNSLDNDLPATTLLTTGTVGVEEYESVLVELLATTVVNDNIGNGEYVINDGSGDYVVDDVIYQFFPETFSGYDYVGIAYYSFNVFKLAPRDQDDITPNANSTVLGLSLSATELSPSEADGMISVSVTIANPATTETTVEVAVTGGTAVNGTHYTFTDPTTLTFPANSTDAQSFTFVLLEDMDVNDDRTITFSLTNGSNGAVFGDSELEVTILDNDGVVVITDIATIAEVDGDGVAVNFGEEFTAAGIVYGVNLRPAGLQFTIRDQTGGMGVFSGDPVSDYVVTEGDSILVTGTVAQFNGLTQLNPVSVELISQNNAIAEPELSTVLSEATESDLVKIECVFIVDPSQWTGSGSGFTVEVSNGADSFDIRIDNDVDLYAAPVPEGSFDLVGIGGQFDDESPFLQGYQVLPRSAADIIPADCNIVAPPAYDDCLNATSLDAFFGFELNEAQATGTYTNAGATVGEFDPAFGYDCFAEDALALQNTVWFSFTGDGLAYHIQTTNCGGNLENYITDGDTQMALYSGACEFETAIVCGESSIDSDAQPLEAGIEIITTSGQTYLLMMDGFAGAQGDFCLDITQIDPEGLAENNAFDFEVFPNPASTIINIQAPKAVESATLTNLLGQTVRTFSFSASERVELDVDDLDAGIYLVRLRSGNEFSTAKLVVE